MNRLAAVHEAFCNALSRISGPSQGYFHDLGGRVYPLMKLPAAGQRTPYVCVPLVEDRPRYVPQGEQGAYMRTVTWRVFTYVTEHSTKRDRSTEVRDLLHLRDDVLLAIAKGSAHGTPLADAGVIVEPADSDGAVAGWPIDGGDYGSDEVAFDVSQLISTEGLAIE